MDAWMVISPKKSNKYKTHCRYLTNSTSDVDMPRIIAEVVGARAANA